MLISFAKQTGNDRPADGGDRFLSLTHYMDAAVVLKPTGPVRRDPVPEVLIGQADVFRRHLGILPTEHRYTSAVLSFAPEDVNVDAFNAGDP
ncbi:MAG TPA: hypothetical protein GX700_15460, partial [Paracoccus sp.]|nr:hypothetical protein [Paracoccus sp. (in: a-proteobacteria)]